MWRRLSASLSPVHSSLWRGGVEATLGLTQSSPLVPVEGGGGGDSQPHSVQSNRPCGGVCGGDSRPHSVQSTRFCEGGVCRRLSASLSPVHSSLRRGGCGGDFRPHSVQSTRPCGKGVVEATLGLTQSSALVPARDGVCGGDSRPHSVQSNCPCEGGVWKHSRPHSVQSNCPCEGGVWKHSRPHSVQSNCPCEGGGGVEATLGLTKSSPLVPVKEGGVWRRLLASLSPVHSSLRRGGGVEATLGLTQSSPLVPAEVGGCGGDSRPHSVQSTRPCGGGGVWRRLSASLSPVHSSLRRWGGVEATLGLTQSSPLVPAEVGGCGGDSRPHSVQSTRPCGGGGVWRRLSASLSPVHSSLRRWGGVEATLGLTQSSPLVPAEVGGCGGDSRPHSVQSTRPCGREGVEATLGLTQSSPLVPAEGGCGGDSRPHSVQSTRPLRRGGGGCGGDSRPHSSQSSPLAPCGGGVGGVEATLGLTQSSPLAPCGGGVGGVEATLGLTQSSPLAPVEVGGCGGDSRPHSVQSTRPCGGGGGGVWRRLSASLSPVHSPLWRWGGVEATLGLTQSSPLVPAEGGCGGDSRPHSVQSTRPCGGGVWGDSWPHSDHSIRLWVYAAAPSANWPDEC